MELSVAVQQRGGAALHHRDIIIIIRVHRQHVTNSRVPIDDGNGWSLCIDDKNYDNIKIIIDMCADHHIIQFHTIWPSLRSPPNSLPQPDRAEHPTGDLGCPQGGVTSRGNAGTEEFEQD
jgi:hypothetical protein